MSMYDQQTIEIAEARIDAENGHMLLTMLEDAWFHQGINAARMGLQPSTLWNHVQRAGWLAETTVKRTLREQREAVCAN